MKIHFSSIVRAVLLLFTIMACEAEKPPYASPEEISIPKLFSEEIETQNGISFSPDGKTLYISLQVADTFDNGRKATGIYIYEYQNDKWVGPEPLSIKGLIDAYHPVQSQDGKRLFFNSRSHPGSPAQYRKHDIWFIEKSNTQWTEPIPVTAINTSHYESYPSVASNGNLYFNSDRPGGKGGMDIYMATFQNGNYADPQPLHGLNSEHAENDLVVDPEERFIIFNRYISANNSIDLWISFKENESWSEPQLLSSINETDIWELTPTISPDQGYFFYERNGKIMQMSLTKLLKSVNPE